MEIDLSEKAELPAAIVNRNSRQSGNGAASAAMRADSRIGVKGTRCSVLWIDDWSESSRKLTRY